MTRFFVFLVGFGLSIIGFVYIISYLNLISLGYNFAEYGKFICSKIECLIGPIGLLIVFISIFVPKGEENELYL